MAVRNLSVPIKNKAQKGIILHPFGIQGDQMAMRREQLAKWENSETNQVPSMRKSIKDSRVQFTESDVFLSACLSGDFDEVQSLLDNGADINTCTVDGLTALHQAVIDGKPEMVQFLTENGADLNAQDNEGWTPLHAAACCGNADMVAYLCGEGADISITNSDKELAVDLAEEDDCKMVLEEEHRRRDIDPDECRNMELVVMQRDAEKWLRDGCYADRPHARTGATALHVAAAKGYIDVLKLLLKAGADVHCRDREGWTPLHAAAHWGEREAAAILMEHGATLEERTNNDETVLSVADKDIVEYLEELRGKGEQARVAVTNNANVSAPATTVLKRAGSVSSVLRLSTEEKTKKTKLDEQDENKDLRESLDEDQYSLVFEQKSPSPSVELRLPCPPPFREPLGAPEPEGKGKPSSSPVSEKSSSVSLSSRESSEEKVLESEKSEMEGESSKEEIPPSSEVMHEKISEESSEKSVVLPVKAVVAAVPHTEVIVRPPVVEVASSSNLTLPMRLNEGRIEPNSSSTTRSDVPTPRAPDTTLAKKRISLLTPPTEPNFPKESEAERRSKAKRQRDSRRSTQGVTKEQVKAATLAAIHREEKENDVAWRGPLRREISKESSSSRDSTSPEKVVSSGNESTSTLLSNLETTSDTAVNSFTSVSNVRRRSQAPRSVRRGTGPVSMEDVQSAFSALGANQKAPLETSVSSPGMTASHTTAVTASTSTAPSNSVTRVVVSLRDRPSPTPQVAITHTAPPVRKNSVPYRTSSVASPYQKPAYITPQEDYKAMYEKERAENERLKSRIDELTNAEKASNLNGSSSLFRRGLSRLGPSSLIKSSSSSSLDEQERRNFERRIAELEFEIKQLEHLRADNQKLKEENGALIRVISKLSKR